MRSKVLLFVSTALTACVLGVSGCAPAVPVQAVHFSPLTDSHVGRIGTAVQDTTVHFASGYTRDIVAGSRWRVIGAIPQGDVLKPVDTVFTIEGRQVHEAYLVIMNGRLQGFYLPGESNFSPLDPSVPLVIGDF